jgi:predicted protein tyrosine phosphatase
MLKLRLSRRQFIRLSMLLISLPLLGLGGAELWWLYHAKRFQEVRKGFLYRTGQPTEYGLKYLIASQGIRTVVTLQTFDPTLKRGPFDPGRPSGREESRYARHLNVRFEQWPLGDEACWPWPSPWHLEEFLRLLDEPSNRPVLIHCQGGRHRTGTLAALFRLEYDRWPIERVLDEMYSFNFGPPVQWQELNLRTYMPRPRPSPNQWQRLKAAFTPLLSDTPPPDYDGLVLALRRYRDRQRLRQAMENYMDDGPFALPLAARLIDSPDDPLAEAAARTATQVISEADQPPVDWAIAAALVADFGHPDQQQKLLDLLTAEKRDAPPNGRYVALVNGVANRYTRNRLPYLRPLVDDLRAWPSSGAKGIRICDLALARMTGILDIVFYDRFQGRGWDGGRQAALNWFAQHADEVRLSQLIPPAGPRMVRAMQAGDEIEGPRRR